MRDEVGMPTSGAAPTELPIGTVEGTKPAVGHYVAPYLPVTGSWIYGQLVNLRRHRAVVMTDRTENLDVFPFAPIFPADRASRFRKLGWALAGGRVRGVSWRYFEEVIEREKITLLHAHFGQSGAEMVDLKRRVRLPMLTAFYGADVSQMPADPYWRALFVRLFEVGDLVLAEGSAMRAALLALGCPPAKVVIQHLGVDTATIPFQVKRPDPDGTVRILIAGTFREKKGIPDALRAIQGVHRQYPKLRATLIGDSAGRQGDDEEKRVILGLLKTLGDVVTWLGYVPYPEFRRQLTQHHIFLSPSVTARDGDSEGGAPIAILEAEASGMPVVSTRHADIPEIVVANESALLSAERDVEALTANLERLLKDPDQWPAMGERGRRHVEESYNVTVQVQRLETLYSQVLGRTR
jgi:colanic acid/amylovoran/stewartan biosynthesis glycosyltransferase WcaL/AmsK/CpsK